MADRKKPRIATRTPRTGRRPGDSSTREEILEAARRQFAEHGYQGATMRAIAADAGVDAALIVHFFGNKSSLLAEAVEWPFDPEVEMPKLFVDGRRHVGRHLATLFVRTWDDEGSRHPILILLSVATVEPQAGEMLSEFMAKRLYRPLMERLGADNPQLRSDLVVSQLVGLGLVRYLQRLEPIASAAPGQVIEWIAPTLQRYLTGKLDGA
jgi:AcrR family transcriptional regulator